MTVVCVVTYKEEDGFGARQTNSSCLLHQNSSTEELQKDGNEDSKEDEGIDLVGVERDDVQQ